ncbi:MAG: acyl-CoA dehydrogenase, partial [Phycisphaerales bacterium]|nr:acyl-CoA dehydrogenase [Phycisphaerales bacterium]
NLLGERGRGYANFLRVLDEGRIAIAAIATGAAQGCVRQSLGRLGQQRLTEIWRGPFADVRQRHVRLTQLPDLCNRCSEWHRP